MKVYEYVWKLNDQMSDGMRKIQKLSNATGGSINRMGAQANSFGNAAYRATDRAYRGMRRLQGQVRQTTDSFSGLKSMALQFISIWGAYELGRSSLNAAADLESLRKAINFASRDAQEAQTNFKFLDQLIEGLGLDAMVAYRGFRTLSGAMKGTKLEGQATRSIFQSVTTATTAMGLSAEQTDGTLIALGQIMSKGKVQAEELRGQLGERIPGAFQIAARAMGMTTAELDKFMADGKLTAEQFLPAFANELQKTFVKGSEDAATGLRAAMNRAGNTFLYVKELIGNQLAPVIIQLSAHLKNAADWVKANWSTVMQWGEAILWAIGIITTFKTLVLAGGAAVTVFTNALNIARVATALFTGQWKVLSAVFMANPIGLVATAITALVGVMVWAYNKFDWFKGGVWGLWEAFKEVFTSIGDMVSNIMGGVVDTIKGVFTGDFALAKKGLADLAKGLVATSGIGFVAQYGDNISEAYRQGNFEGQLDANSTTASGVAGQVPKIPEYQPVNPTSLGLGGTGTSVTGSEKEKADMYSEFREIIAMAKNPSVLTDQQRSGLDDKVRGAYDQISSLIALFELSKATGQQFDSLRGYDKDRLTELQGQLSPYAKQAEDELEFKQGLSAITGGGKKVTNISIGEVKYADNVNVEYKDSREHAGDMRQVLERELAELMNDFNRDADQ